MKTPKPWYQIRAAAGEAVEILIYDEIGRNFFGEGIAAEQFVKDLADIRGRALDVRINSVGGQVFEGLAIYNALARHDAKVTVHIDGIAASIASIIALAGQDVRIAANAFMMIHNPHGIAWGNSADMREMADTLEKIAGSLVGIYQERTGRSAEAVRAWMDGETWFTAAEAKEAGLVHQVVEAQLEDVRASGDLTRFSNLPEPLKPRAAAAAPAVMSLLTDEMIADAVLPNVNLMHLSAASMRTLSRTAL